MATAPLSVLVFPASAGMNRLLAIWSSFPGGIPRIRGDEPNYGLLNDPALPYSPHPRG